jgi:hypothetical protein
MPTIDELAPAAAASDSDEIMLSQSGIARRVTRAQLLSGLQPALSLSSASLLGRVSPGIGAAEGIAIGGNLTLENGTLDSPPAFSIANLAQAMPVQPGDLVSISQGGENRAVSYGSFIGGISEVEGVDGSDLLATAAGGQEARRLGDLFGDSLSIANFGAVGDGITDDTAAFIKAASAGLPLRLDGRTYLINGPLMIETPVIMLGVAGATVLQRGGSDRSAGVWVQISGSSFRAEGITFNAGDFAGSDLPAVDVMASCAASTFSACSFLNAWGPASGCGLSIEAASGSTHCMTSCLAQGNMLHGVTVKGTGTISITNSIASNNGGNGVDLADGLAARVCGTTCTRNACGISYGLWSGPAPLAAAGGELLASSNSCTGNAAWGVALAGSGVAVCSNFLSDNGNLLVGGGLLAWTSGSLISHNIISGGAYGIDARGSTCSIITENVVSGTGIGCATGGCTIVTVAGNLFQGNGWGVVATAFEPTRSASPTADLTVHMNRVAFTAAQGGGILLLDGVQGVAVTQNAISGSGSAAIGQALWAHTDAALVSGNTWLNQARTLVPVTQVAGAPAIIFPDIADEVLVAGNSASVQSLLSSRQLDTVGQIMFVRVAEGGSGYTKATVALTGSGTGAAATAIVYGGQVRWITVTNAGSGYGPIGTPVQVTITGDGVGGAASAWSGLPALGARKVRLVASSDIRLIQAGSSPLQTSWSGFDVTIPANGAAELEGLNGNWCALASPPIDYLLPTGDGGAILQSSSGGNLTLRPSAGGSLMVASAEEPMGCISALGRGSPTGRVDAPPGSEFRNLDGGVGNTLWIKQTGTDSNGWFAIA